jgi:hypothetical protein
MAKLFNTEKLVKTALTKNVKARDNDQICYGQVLLDLGFDLNISLREFLRGNYEQEIPSFKSVERARRKLQEIHKELQGTKKNSRLEENSEYIAYNNTGKSFHC